MKDKEKKYLISLLAVMIIIGAMLIMPVTARAAKVSGKCGDSIFWLYNEQKKTLIIAGSGKMYDYSYHNDAPWKHMAENPDEALKYDDSQIDKVIIGSEITYIGEEAFSGLLIYEVEFDNIASSKLESIGEYAFSYCNSLDSIKLPSSLKKIGKHAFSNSAFSSFTIPSSCKEIGDYAFSGCIFTRIEIPNTVKKVGKYAFGYRAYNTDDDYTLDDSTPKKDIHKVPGFDVVGPKSGIASSTAFKYAKKYKLNYVMKGVKGPKIKSAANVKTRRIRLKWNKSGSASGYHIRYSTSKKFDIYTTIKYITVKGRKTTSRKTAQLKKNKTYYITVRYYKYVGGKKCYSEWWKTAKKVKIKK